MRKSKKPTEKYVISQSNGPGRERSYYLGPIVGTDYTWSVTKHYCKVFNSKEDAELVRSGLKEPDKWIVSTETDQTTIDMFN